MPHSPPTSDTNQNSKPDRDRERQQYRTRLVTALNEEDDPLAVYHSFVQWTVKNYGERDATSGLLELLEDATKQFKEDPSYKTDLRYLKLWSLYARQLEQPRAIEIYAYLVEKDIGTSYSILYEEYTTLLEKAGRNPEAEAIYRRGIKRQVRPLERLRNKYKQFQSRVGTSASSTSISRPSPSISKSSAQDNNNIKNQARASPSSSTSPSAAFNSTAASRYALMLAPPAPGKRPEKMRFNLSLLFTDEGVEYSIQEARARSMGLLGKKWSAPPPTESIRKSMSYSTSSSSTQVDFNDGGHKRLMQKRKSILGGGAEPTVTINTKEALADVFGMFNSPDKTQKLPGSKHAPLKRVEPVTPIVPPKLAFSRSQEHNENSITNPNQHGAKTPTAFRPFVDENAQPRATPAAKFTPFVDSEPHKTPFTPRAALSLKDTTTTPSTNTRSNENALRNPNISRLKSVVEESNAENVYSKVFTPVQTKPVPLAPLRDVFTDDHGKPIPKPKSVPTHERAKSHDISDPKPDEIFRPVTFKPFVDENARTPFKVFSRPPENENSGNVFTAPKTPIATFTPFQDAKTPAFTPFRDAPGTFNPPESKEDAGIDPNGGIKSIESLHTTEPPNTRANDIIEVEDDEGEERQQGQYDYEEEESQVEEYEVPIAPEHVPEMYDEGDSFQEIPLGGRFGQFNVMTPITERTFEYTMSTRGGETPGGRQSEDEDRGSPKSKMLVHQNDENGAIQTARKLAAELEEENDTRFEEEETEDEPLEPLRLSDGLASRHDPAVAILEEKAGSLSLVDTLTLGSNFRPPNPCNPFDPPILTALLSRIPTDPQFYDLRENQAKLLEPLQRFSKKGRKSSGSSASGDIDLSVFPVTLNGNRFIVSEKLGEGGFGCVFKARDLGMRNGEVDDEDEDEDMEDDDEENASMVALKIVKPRNIWEYHVLRRLRSALPIPLRRSIVLPHALYAYGDESFLVLDLCPQGMLLNIINNAVAAGVSQAGACLDELLVMFFTTELLRLLEGMHSTGFIHGDLKIDNCLLRLEDVPGGAAAWSSMYQPSGEGGWSHKGLKLIDFGRTVDTRLFPAGQQFIAEWPADERDCFEIQNQRPWTYQTDYFGLAGIIYCMLFGKYIQQSSVTPVTVGEGEQRYRISTPLKRYWQTEIWTRLFDVLLNPCLVRPKGELPVCDELAGIRKDMEVWLQANCNRTSNTLKGLLKKVEMACYRSL